MSVSLRQQDLYTMIQDIWDRLTRLEKLVPIDNWTTIGEQGAPAFENSWVNYGGTNASAAYYRDPFNVVRLKGLVKNGTIGGVPIFTLPVGYRPLEDVNMIAMSNGGVGYLFVQASSGEVRAIAGSNTYFSLDNVTFRAEQ